MLRPSLLEVFDLLGISICRLDTEDHADPMHRETTMWPWRFQTLSGATGSAFAFALVNSYGQIGAAIGPQIFNSRFAPRYTTSFAIGLGFVGVSILMAAVTWWATYRVEHDTRMLRKARLAARKRNETVLDDVDLNADKKIR